jgi:type VI secretion system protein ImpK
VNRDLIEKTYWACSELLSLGTQMRNASDLPPPEDLQRRIGEMFDRMSRRCRELGILEDDAVDAKYAICAFLDEQVLASPWPGRNFWLHRPLQLVYFNENTAGEGFFTRLEALRRNHARANVTAIYYACLQLGFLGRYAVYRGEGLAQLTDQLALELGKELPAADVISPHGEPKDGAARGGRRDTPVLIGGVAVLGVAVLVFLLMKVSLLVSTSSVNSKLNSATVTGAPNKP